MSYCECLFEMEVWQWMKPPQTGQWMNCVLSLPGGIPLHMVTDNGPSSLQQDLNYFLAWKQTWKSQQMYLHLIYGHAMQLCNAN